MDEFIFISSGRGTYIGDDEFVVSTGDFMGFAAGHLAHSMSSPSNEDLVYLMGGHRIGLDVGDYPRIERRQYTIDRRKEYAD